MFIIRRKTNHVIKIIAPALIELLLNKLIDTYNIIILNIKLKNCPNLNVVFIDFIQFL